MRWATYRSPLGNQDHIGLLHEDAVYGLAEPGSLTDLLRGGEQALRRPLRHSQRARLGINHVK